MPQAILLADHENLGAKGTVVDVSKGYLRNYLIPRKLAEPATRGAIAAAERRAVAAERAVADATAKAEESAALLNKTVLTIAAPGRRRRPPVRLGHLAGHRRRHQGGARHHDRPARTSTSRSRSRPSAPAWSSSRSRTA